MGELDAARRRAAHAVSDLKRNGDGEVLVAGSRSLVHQLYAHDLVDEWRLMVFPVVLGSGRRIFPDGADVARRLGLADVRRFESGVVVQTYRQLSA